MDRVMMVTPTRIAYAGLLGSPSDRSLGAHVIYVARDNPFAIQTPGNSPDEGVYLASVAPNEVHTIHSPDRIIWKLLIEPECVNGGELQRFVPRRAFSRDAHYAQLHTAFSLWLGEPQTLVNVGDEAVDRLFFGHSLPPLRLDARVRRSAELIRTRPCEPPLASECARHSALSVSRFIHLFADQIGMPFRTFCAWKRARAVLCALNSGCNLTDLALDTGYPDSSHFSHSIRRIYGLRPRDMVAGSRRLVMVEDSGV